VTVRSCPGRRYAIWLCLALASVYGCGPSPPSGQLPTRASDGQTPAALWHLPGPVQGFVAFSPSGDEIVVAVSEYQGDEGTRGGHAAQTSQLLLLKPRGEIIVLTSGYPDDQPSWSPDGKRIAFRRMTGPARSPQSVAGENGPGPPTGFDELDFTLSVVDVANRRLWTPEQAEGTKSYPEFSPDGRWLAYDLYYRPPDGGHIENAYGLVELSSGATRITHPGPWYVHGLGQAWNQSGRRLVAPFALALESRVELWMYDLRTDHWSRIAAAEGRSTSMSYPRFDPEGKSVSYVSYDYKTNSSSMHRVDLPSGEVHLAARLQARGGAALLGAITAPDGGGMAGTVVAAEGAAPAEGCPTAAVIWTYKGRGGEITPPRGYSNPSFRGWSPDARRIAVSFNDDRDVAVYDLP